MDVSDLFIERQQWVKQAGETTLPDDPNVWPQEILQELYKQVPYISDFDPHVNMVKVDAERGFGFGQVDVANRSEMQFGTPPDQQMAAGIRHVRLPVIISQGKLQPFDLLITSDNRMMPLTEERLRRALFRPQMFDVTSKTPGDQSIVNQLYPPFRQNYGFGGSGVSIDKISSASLFDEALATARTSDWREMTDTILSDANLRASMLKNAAAMRDTVAKLFAWEPPVKLASVLPYCVHPTVTLIQRAELGYRVKEANPNFWAPTVRMVDRGQLVRQYGEKVALAADMTGSVTFSADDPAVKGEPEQPGSTDAPITVPGIYRVQTDDGRQLTGSAFPNLLDHTGKAAPLVLFTDGSEAAIQGEMVGTRVGDLEELPLGQPGGYGVFVSPEGSETRVTIPMRLNGSFRSPAGPATYMGVSWDGQPMQVSIQPFIQTVIAGDEGKLLIPQGWRWLALPDQQVGIHAAAGEVAKRAGVDTITIRGSRNSFSFSGAPVEKLAAVDVSSLPTDEAMFLLSAMGVGLQYGVSKLAEASTGYEPIDVQVARGIVPFAEQVKTAQQKAAQIDAEFPKLRCCLVKEAAELPDPVAVDTVLSLGFITPENILTFVGYLPVLEDAQNRLCDLLFAARLGMKNLPINPLERSVRALETVLDALRVIAFKS